MLPSAALKHKAGQLTQGARSLAEKVRQVREEHGILLFSLFFRHVLQCKSKHDRNYCTRLSCCALLPMYGIVSIA